MSDSLKDIFGAKTLEMIALANGLDEEGEFKGIYRPTGHPGVCYFIPSFGLCPLMLLRRQLWFGGAAFPQSRFMSKQLVGEIPPANLVTLLIRFHRVSSYRLPSWA